MLSEAVISRRAKTTARVGERALRLLAGCALLLAAAAPALAQPQVHHGGYAGGRRGGWGYGAPAGPPRGGGRAVGGGWDARRYNGYWASGRWYYGAPPHPAYQAPGFRPGFTPFRRGAFLPPDYQGFVLDDYWRYHLRRPPYGYNWVQVGNQFLLVSASTGLIFDVVTGY
jgi:Ni/Co efflux regulator RcnB